MEPLPIRKVGGYSRVVYFPAFLRGMLGWYDKVKELEFKVEGNKLILSPYVEVKTDDKKTVQ